MQNRYYVVLHLVFIQVIQKVGSPIKIWKLITLKVIEVYFPLRSPFYHHFMMLFSWHN